MGTTSNYSLPYPESTDYVADGATAIENLADAIDSTLANRAGGQNLLINGAMQVAQRKLQQTGITSGPSYHTLDRWLLNLNLGTVDMEQDTESQPYGFPNNLRIDTVTGSSLSVGSYAYIQQRIEGQNLQQIKKGTSDAEKLTVSFWVRSNHTGTYIVRLNDESSRICSQSYTINAANTWEYKTLTYPADTTGTITNDNADRFSIQFWLAAGSNYTSGTLATTWQAYNAADVAVGQTNFLASSSRDWRVTGVKMELGDTATPFQYRTFAEELAECQRYYEKSYNYNINPGTPDYTGAIITYPFTTTSGRTYVTQTFAVQKRTTPTMTFYSVADGSAGFWFEGGFGNRSAGIDDPGEHAFQVRNTVVLAGTGTLNTQWVANAEL
jgi:hypothetical protein